MAMKPFSKVAVGDKFVYNNQLWARSKVKKKGCCGTAYNAHMVGNAAVNKVFKDSEEVDAVAEETPPQ